MMERLNHDQGQLFYSFCLDEAVPDDHRVREIAAVLDLHTTGRIHDGETILYRARTSDCGLCPLKARCCPKAPERKIPRSLYDRTREWFIRAPAPVQACVIFAVALALREAASAEAVPFVYFQF